MAKRVNAGSYMTRRWREMDSNFRSPVKRTTFSRLPNWIRQFRGKRLRIRWQPPESRNRLSGSMLRAAPCNFSCPHKQQSSAGALKAQGRAAMPSSGRTGCPLQRRVLSLHWRNTTLYTAILDVTLVIVLTVDHLQSSTPSRLAIKAADLSKRRANGGMQWRQCDRESYFGLLQIAIS